MIILECNNDEFLIKSLGFPGKRISHQRCKGEVVKKVGKTPIAVGIIDEDLGANVPREMDKYSEVSENRTDRTIKLFQKRDDKNKKLVIISPYLEHWILNRAKKNKIEPKDFHLPGDPKKLHQIPNLKKDKNFREFLAKLIEVDDEIKILKTWIKEAVG